MKLEPTRIDRDEIFPSPDVTEYLLTMLEWHGFPARIVPAVRAGDLRREIEGRRTGGEFDEEFFGECLAGLSFDPPSEIAARSIVVAAVPRPETAAVFHFEGERRSLPIPPTYSGYRTVMRDWVAWFDGKLRPIGYRAVGSDLPLKLLANRSGLASYGRNNIAYVEGLGSYFQLVSAWTDIPCEADSWADPRMLARCLDCRACVNRCPTKAIRLDRFLLEAERCLVFHNERDSVTPFPSWIDPDAHHAVVGCLQCQWVCPENKHVRGRVGETEEFSTEETELLLGGPAEGSLSEETARKVRRLDATRLLARMPRNVLAAFRARGSRGGSAERGPAR